jgi:hypothetical protein
MMGNQIQGKMFESVTVLAETNERVMTELFELGAATVRESFKGWLAMQAAAVDACRAIPAPSLPQGDVVEELRRDPLAWYRKGLQAAADGVQRATGLAETNARIVARNAEAFQASTERATKEIEGAATVCVNRMREIYAR